MEEIKIGKKYVIHSYKHDGKIHRSWDEAVLLKKTPEYLVFGNNKTIVTEVDGRTWKTKEPAIMFFFYDKWFNVIGQIKKDGIYYYCNMASPFIIEDNAIKYIDYDLDLRVFPDSSFKILDKNEYKYHKKKMNYSKNIDMILKNELNFLIAMVKKQELVFNFNTINEYYNEYLKNKEKSEN